MANGYMTYEEVDQIKAALVGRSIVSQEVEGSDYQKVISFTLDDGTVLRAHASDGGCACSNGCFSVDSTLTHTGTILNVEVSEHTYDDAAGGFTHEIVPGSIGEGSSVIKVFVYTELNKRLPLVESAGGDNGYYGWGFWFDVVDNRES